jgi:hypothetical protein
MGWTCRQYKRTQRMKLGRKRHEMMCSHSRHCIPGVQIFFLLFALLRDRVYNWMLCYTVPHMEKP